MKYIYLIFALLACSILFAEPTYMPVTTIAEDFGATWCLNCPLAWQGLQAVHSVTHAKRIWYPGYLRKAGLSVIIW